MSGRQKTYLLFTESLVLAMVLLAPADPANRPVARDNSGAQTNPIKNGSFEEGELDPWVRKIRRDHPRLFINRDIWPTIKASQRTQGYYKMLKELADKPGDRWIIEGNAQFSALLYLMTGDKQYLALAKDALQKTVAYYLTTYDGAHVECWNSEAYIIALTAYDWICADLTREERQALMGPWLKYIDDLQPGPGKPQFKGHINRMGIQSGFYSVQNLTWFAGLAAYGDGINDELALKLLKQGYRDYQQVRRNHALCAGDDGGAADPSIGYAAHTYPTAEFNFLHTWYSATGENIAGDWGYWAYFPVWIWWNMIPTQEGAKEFGAGYAHHYRNKLEDCFFLYGHLDQVIHFYGQAHPECAALAALAQANLPVHFWVNRDFHAILMTNPAPRMLELGRYNLHARHFRGMGQVSMRSGSGSNDTYCLFSVDPEGPTMAYGKHYDENNFVIYKKGFLALDSGGRWQDNSPNSDNYSIQTIAHNCVLIHMPDEPLNKGNVICHGGQNNKVGGKAAAFETNARYTYVAGDATAAYSDKKCKLALRQFVFVMPDYFVICDRVVATRPEYKKEWLLHTQNEPVVSGKEFYADENEGRLFCRTLLPKDAALAKIGGPGREFWANGTNWADNLEQMTADFLKKTGKPMLLGNWRMEVSPGKAREGDVFLHLIQVGDKSSLKRMTESKLIEEQGRIGVEFRMGDKLAKVTFATAGPPAGHIAIVSGSAFYLSCPALARLFGKLIVDNNLTDKVMPQSGLGIKQE